MQGLSRAVVVASRTCVPLLNIVHLYPGQPCQSFDRVQTGLVGAFNLSSRDCFTYIHNYLLKIVYLYPGQLCILRVQR